MSLIAGGTRVHPIDFSRLEKGMWIEVDELEAAVMKPCTHPSFGIDVMKLRERIYDETGIVSRCEGNRVRLMTDSEALVYSVAEARRGVAKIEKNRKRLSRDIDTSRLTDEEKRTHEHAVRAVSSIAIAARRRMEKNARLFSLTHRSLPASIDGHDDGDDGDEG